MWTKISYRGSVQVSYFWHIMKIDYFRALNCGHSANFWAKSRNVIMGFYYYQYLSGNYVLGVQIIVFIMNINEGF